MRRLRALSEGGRPIRFRRSGGVHPQSQYHGDGQGESWLLAFYLCLNSSEYDDLPIHVLEKESTVKISAWLKQTASWARFILSIILIILARWLPLPFLRNGRNAAPATVNSGPARGQAKRRQKRKPAAVVSQTQPIDRFRWWIVVYVVVLGSLVAMAAKTVYVTDNPESPTKITPHVTQVPTPFAAATRP